MNRDGFDSIDEDTKIMIEQDNDVIEIEDWQYKKVFETLFLNIKEV